MKYTLIFRVNPFSSNEQDRQCTEWGQLSGRAPDSQSKGHGFESQQENFLLQSQLSVLTVILLSIPPPCYCRKHTKDPGHSAKSAGGRLQLSTHAPYVYVALHEVMWYVAWLYGVHRTHLDGSSFSWHQPCNNQTALQAHFGENSKHETKS